jgi:integrase
MTLPKHVRRKVAKGREYFYFATGVKVDGKEVLKPLPHVRDPDFGRMLSAAQSGRTRREKVQGVLTIAALADLYEKSPDFRGLAATTRRSYELNLDKARNRLGIAPANELTSADVRLVHDEMADQTGAANQYVRLPVALLYYTAQRIGDVCRMRWSDVTSAGSICLTQEKTKKALALPIHAELGKLLASAPKQGLTILAVGGKQPEKVLRDRLQAWAEARGQHIVPHGLRKNAVIALLECGCSVAETAAISGQTLSLVEHYAKQRDQAKLASAAILRWENKGGQGKRK